MESAPNIEICTQMYDRETGAQQFRRLLTTENHHRRPRVFICREWSPTIAEVWDALGKQNAPDIPDLSPPTPENLNRR